jgi:hypothetical protein
MKAVLSLFFVLALLNTVEVNMSPAMAAGWCEGTFGTVKLNCCSRHPRSPHCK